MRTAFLAFALLAGSAAADTLALKDGRFFEGRPIDRTEWGYVIKFENGEVVVPGVLVLDFFEEDDQGGFVPQTDREKAKFAKGYVPYRGRWVRISTRERMRKKEKEERRLAMEQAKARRYWRNHATVTTKRFIFLHTLPDAIFQEFQDLFETYYDFFTKYWHFTPSSKFGKVTINIYHDREYFEQVSGAPSGVVGWYMPTEKDLHFFYDRQNHRYTIDVMFHEGNHMLTHMINERMWYPWWIGEGMAEYFGASEWDPKDKTMKLGRVQSGRLAVLHTRIKDGKLLKLEDLLEAESMGAVEYAWAWSLCHFLLHTPEYAKKFKKYFMAIGRDGSLRRVARFLTTRQLSSEERVASFKEFMRVRDLEALQKEWYEYIKNQLALERQELNWGEAGHIMEMYGELAQARRFYKKAIDNGSRDAYVHYGYAKLKQRQNMPGVAAKYAQKATEFDPLHARAWSLWGGALHSKGEETAEGLRLLKLACELDPDDSQIWFALESALQKEREKKEKEEGKGKGKAE